VCDRLWVRQIIRVFSKSLEEKLIFIRVTLSRSQLTSVTERIIRKATEAGIVETVASFLGNTRGAPETGVLSFIKVRTVHWINLVLVPLLAPGQPGAGLLRIAGFVRLALGASGSRFIGCFGLGLRLGLRLGVVLVATNSRTLGDEITRELQKGTHSTLLFQFFFLLFEPPPTLEVLTQ
jgi:hypothetical protein